MRFFLKTQPMLKNSLLKYLMVFLLIGTLSIHLLQAQVLPLPLSFYAPGNIGYHGTKMINFLPSRSSSTLNIHITDVSWLDPHIPINLDSRPVRECGNISRIIIGTAGSTYRDGTVGMDRILYSLSTDPALGQLNGSGNSNEYDYNTNELELPSVPCVVYIEFITPENILYRGGGLAQTQIAISQQTSQFGAILWDRDHATKIDFGDLPLSGRIVDLVDAGSNDDCKAGKITAILGPCTNFSCYRWSINGGTPFETQTNTITLEPDLYNIRVEGSEDCINYSPVYQELITLGYQTTTINGNILSAVEPHINTCQMILGVYFGSNWQNCIKEITCKDERGNELRRSDNRRDRFFADPGDHTYTITITLQSGRQLVFTQFLRVSNPCPRKKIQSIENDVIVAPNPVSDILRITTSLKGGQLELVNTIGQAVLTQRMFDTDTQLNIQQLQEGIYIVKIYDSINNLISSQKIVIQR